MAHSHSHSHAHGDDELDAAPLRRGLVLAVLAAALVAIVLMVVWWPRGPGPDIQVGASFEYVDATVTGTETRECSSIELPDALVNCQIVTADVTSGGASGDVATFRIYETDFDKPELSVGDDVVLLRNPQVDPSVAYTFSDFQRTLPLVALAVLFVVVVVLLGRFAGLRALLGIVVSFAVIFLFLLPSLLRGNPALPVAMAATVAIAVAVLYLAHGVRTSTTVALVGTLISLVVVAVLAQLFVGLTHLTGLAGDESQVLRVTADAIDLRALLVAAIVIGALGVLDDVTVTQVSAVMELRRARPDAPRWELYRQAIRIGRDHIASTVNTLVLAYAGASLPLLLVFVESDRPWSRLVTSEIVAVEIVRTLVGSIGLVLAVPVTTGLAALLLAAPDDGEEVDARGAGDGSDHSGVRPEDWDGFGPAEDPW
jgi:uncharacterized membrane protein